MSRQASPTRARAKSRPTRRRRPAQRRRPSAAKRRRAAARRKRIATWMAIALVPALLLAFVVAAFVGTFSGPRALTPLPSPPALAEYSQEQRDNAALIMVAGRDLGLSVRDQAIGVMTAMGESSLRNIDYGDWETSGVTNPDGSRTTSIGLFQQQDGWGTRDERLDPYTSAAMFYRAMIDRVPDRDGLEPTIVAHRTQVNRDPNHYARYWARAVTLIESLSGEDSGLAR